MGRAAMQEIPDVRLGVGVRHLALQEKLGDVGQQVRQDDRAKEGREQGGDGFRAELPFLLVAGEQVGNGGEQLQGAFQDAAQFGGPGELGDYDADDWPDGTQGVLVLAGQVNQVVFQVSGVLHVILPHGAGAAEHRGADQSGLVAVPAEQRDLVDPGAFSDGAGTPFKPRSAMTARVAFMSTSAVASGG